MEQKPAEVRRCLSMAQSHPDLLGALLRDVSRSFYLTLRVLPTEVRPQIGLAYLLARTTDTIADTELVPVSNRLDSLRLLADRIQGKTAKPLDLSSYAAAQSSGDGASKGSEAERLLLTRVEEALSLLGQYSAQDQEQIRKVLLTITSGQEMDLLRFGSNDGEIRSLNSDEELDDYTYRVAGCVGEFWTNVCSAHLFPKAKIDYPDFLKRGIHFGQGLQLVNILRDLPKDLRQGRCYIPSKRLADHGLKPMDLISPENHRAFQPLYEQYLSKAATYLEDGWSYTCSIPRGCARVRLACAWPILIGIKTLRRLGAANILDPRMRVKVTRKDVRNIMISTVLRYPFAASWAKLFENDVLVHK